MATLLLSAAGAAFGGGVGGSFLGLTTLALGKAAGASLGSILDQKLLGLGAAPVETGRVERFRILGSSEGAALPRVFGRMRLAGQIIWSSQFLEHVTEERVGGKGGGPTARQYSYSISLAIALCEGEVLRVGRIWADGQPISQSGLNWRLHCGTEDQLPDPLIEAIEGTGRTPAYRGTAYIVFEYLDLTSFGNRIPQFNFEVFRRPEEAKGVPRHPAGDIRGVALVPGTGEYALATDPVTLNHGRGAATVMNVNNDRGVPDLLVSLDQMTDELPNCRSVSLVVSWFGDDLRCDRCTLQPAVEQRTEDGRPMAWQVSGVQRGEAKCVSRLDDRPVFGGTPADASVVHAIRALRGRGMSVMFYPFILMDIPAGNSLPNPWNPGEQQPAVPWRGRITLSRAPGEAETTDKTPSAADEVVAFFGSARGEDFRVGEQGVTYSGPLEWSYRRFVLHYAHLCAFAGGVDAFCIGSEMRGLTQVRDGAASYPAVRELCRLADDVRHILGSKTKIGYAADWSEYFGHQPADGSGDFLFHLDPLWSHNEIDFVGIDNYMPLSDWRDGADHKDAAKGSIYNLDYLTANVAGGEGFDWFYASDADRDAQVRSPIADGAYGEDWVYRYKDLVNWWSRPHENRMGGAKTGGATDWKPRSKPIWFTELGCPAVDKGTNQPNVFYDPKSSESFFPYHSNGARDDYIQSRYLQATLGHWRDPENNPYSEVYGGRMVDLAQAYVWAWDARPWPDFPVRLDTWSDGANHDRGHWLNGRMSNAALAEVVAEVSLRAGLKDVDVGELYGLLTGYSIGSVETARQTLQPLMLAFGFDGTARGDKLAFTGRTGRVATDLDMEILVENRGDATITRTRGPQAETAGRVAVAFVRSDMDYQTGAAEAVSGDAMEPNTAQSSLPLVLGSGEAKAIAERWLAETRIARDTVKFTLPPSKLCLVPGDVIAIPGNGQPDLYRVDRIDEQGSREVAALRIEAEVYHRPVLDDLPTAPKIIIAPTAVFAVFLDLPLLSGDEVPYAPHLAVAKKPWTGPISVYSASEDHGYDFVREVRRPATTGVTLDPLPAGQPGLWMAASMRVQLDAGALQSRSQREVLNGANAAALRFGGTGEWEVFQFTRAELVSPQTYRLDGLLRGQAGTDWVTPELWPAGTDFVLIDTALVQLEIPASTRALERHYRVGPSSRSYDDPSYIHHVEAFSGNGLRPYRPTHLAASRLADGAINITWIRRTRIDGDSWQGTDVPIGEGRLQFHVKISSGSLLLHEAEIETSGFVYSVRDQASDGAALPLTIEVAQMSERFGPGPYEEVIFSA